MKFKRLPRPLSCPWCETELRSLARAAGPRQKLGAGDHFICVHCGGIATFDGRELVAKRWNEIPEDDVAGVLEARADLRGVQSWS